MYILDELKPAFREIFRTVYSSESWQELFAVNFSSRVARMALASCGFDESKAPELCLETAREFFEPVERKFPQNVYSEHQKIKRKQLGLAHQSMVPSDSPSFRSFKFDEIQSVIYDIGDELGLCNFEGTVSNEYFQFTSCNVSSNSGLKLVFLITGNMSSTSVIKADCSIYREDGELAQISLGKLFGVGFWRPCKKNTKATIEDLYLTTSEPMRAFRLILDAV